MAFFKNWRPARWKTADPLRDSAGETAGSGHDDSVAHSWDTEVVYVAVDIDCGIAPLVRALQIFPGCRTLFSCAGHPHSRYERRAYVGMSYHAEGLQIDQVAEAEAAYKRFLSDLEDILQAWRKDGWELELHSSYVVLWLEPELVESAVRMFQMSLVVPQKEDS